MSLFKRFFAWSMATGDAAQERIYGAIKRDLFAGVRGIVLELGPGTGVNLPFMPAGIDWIGAEPNLHMHPYIQKKARDRGLSIRLVTDSAGALSLPDASVDTVISTLVLCSVPDQAAALREIRRVLKPGGRFYFIEHVAAPAGRLRRAQHLIKPFWRVIGDGCCPDRDTGDRIREAGFAEVHLERFNARMPIAIVRPHIRGHAVRANAA
ncbi:MAG: methyltransferase domain-containing protein [Rhodothermales bacterium]|nr:methyltransferase domain-containing protein [Rhodothermales bacterium]